LTKDYLPHLDSLCRPSQTCGKSINVLPKKKNKAVTNKAARNIGDGNKQYEKKSDDETASHEENCNDNEDIRELHEGEEFDIYGEPEEEVVQDQGTAIDDQSSPNRGRFLCG
jgi:hypothetical protein